MTNQRAIILLCQMYLPTFDEEEKEAITKAIEVLTETIEADPVCSKHGQWMYGEKSDAYDINGVKTWALAGMCSECGFTHRFIEAHTGQYTFCPACGARLET